MTDRVRKLFPYVLLAPAILPLLYIGGVLYPYITPKTFLLQGAGLIALAIFAYLALLGEPFYYGRLRNRLTWIPAALLAVEYVTSLFGVNFYHSFWGLFERGDGLFTYSIVTVFFYLILLSADRALWDRLMKTVAVVAGIVALVAVLQWLTASVGGRLWFLPPITGRIGSTFGNAAFLAGYLGMAFFLILIALRDASGKWRMFYKISAGLSLLAIVFAATRGTMLALILTGMLALSYRAWKGGGMGKNYARSGLAAIFIIGALFFVFRAELARVPFEPIQRVASISVTDITVGSRFFVWSNILSEALKRPLTGYGAEHVAHLFDRIYDPGSILEQWFDRSHNAFLDYFAQYGVLGLLLYLALLVAFAYSAVRLYRKEGDSCFSPGLMLLFMVLTYAIQNFFVFDTPASLWLLYALYALLLAMLSDVTVTAYEKRPFGGTAAILIALLIIPCVLMPLYANFLLTRGYHNQVVDVAKANADFERGLALGTYADLEYGYQAYDMYTGRQAVMLEGDTRVAAYTFALSTLSKDFRKYPYDARTATYLAHVIDTAPPEVEIDQDFYATVLARALSLSPLRAQPWYLKANIYLREADLLKENDPRKAQYFREAISILEEYAAKEPTLPVPPFILTTLYYKLGDTATAKRWADIGYKLYTVPEPAAAGPAVKYYIAIEDWVRAKRFLADMVATNPNDYEVLYDLAKVTYLAGDPAGSLLIVEKLRIVNPEILSTDPNFMAAITAYERAQN